MNRFDCVRYDILADAKQKVLKSKFVELATLVECFPESRAQELALTKLEEAYMWVGKAVRDEQVNQRLAELQERTEVGEK